MPMFLVFAIVAASFITAIVYLCYAVKRSRLDYLTFFIVFVLLGSFVTYWLCDSWNQDICEEDYHCIRNIKFDNGTMIQEVIFAEEKETRYPYNASVINITKKFNVIFPDNTIIKTYRYKSIKNGIWWINGSRLCCEPILPNDEDYERVKKLTKDIKMVKSP